MPIRGQACFKLSLFGYEPETDFDAITKAADGNRINRIQPENSLVLIKLSFKKPSGGERFKPDSVTLAGPGKTFKLSVITTYIDG